MSRVALYFPPLCKTAPQSFLCTASHYKNNPEYSELLYVLLSLNSANACQPKKTQQKNKKSSLTWTEEGKGCQDNLRLRRRQVGVGDRWNGEAWLLYFKDSIFYLFLFHFPLLSVALCATARKSDICLLCTYWKQGTDRQNQWIMFAFHVLNNYPRHRFAGS